MSRGGTSPYDGSHGPEPRERRAGGYGGFYEGASAVAGSSERLNDQELDPSGANWRRRADRGDREYSERQRERNRSRANGGRTGVRSIEEILAAIQHDWPFMTTDDCVPVKVALQLSDSSSLGRADQYGTFKDQHKQLQKALRTIVNEHHQGFNSSIGTFHKIQNSIANSQHKVRTLRGSLVAAKTDLSTTKPELKGLATTSQTYDDMLQVLGQIEQLQNIQEKLDTRITEKRFLTAVDILQDGLRLIRRSEMDSIGALADLRTYLTNQETSLKDILIEELHSHLYLKSPYCQGRWKSHINGQNQNNDPVGTPSVPMGAKTLYIFLDKLDVSKPMIEDASRNPEADSFYYIQLLIESLNKMGRLDDAVESIKQRLPTELDRLVDRTNNEVDQRHSSALRASVTKEKSTISLSFTENDVRAVVIHDLLGTLYSKFEAVAESHRVFHDVVSGIGRRENLRNTSPRTGGFKELWQLYQNEMKKILHDYLATDGEFSFRSGITGPGGTNVFQKNWRDKSKKMFKLNETDKKATDMTGDQEDLESILKSSVPGLVSESRRPTGPTAEENAHHHDGSATGHKLLIEPNVFNMALLLPPSLSFLQRLKEIVPPDSEIVTSTLTSFLDDFLVNVFHPQLDETLTELSTQTFVEADAFQEDPQWQTVARKPIFKGTLAFFNLITAFCKMLDTIPHDQAFSQLIITQMVTYYDKSFGLYKSLIARTSSTNDTSHQQIAPALSDSGTFHELLAKSWTSKESEKVPLIEEQAMNLLGEIKQKPLEAKDLMLNYRTIDSLCLLYTSMKWLASKISQLRQITSVSSDSSHRDTVQISRRWTQLGPTKVHDETSLVQLPMTSETAFLFDGVLTSYNELAIKSLCALHTEIRCRVLFNFKSYLQPSYLLSQPVSEPDPSILSLNTDLVRFDETVRTALPVREHDFITRGLAFLLSAHFIDMMQTHITALNVNGANLLLVTIIVLQQNLKNIEKQNDDVLGNALDHSKAYIETYLLGPDGILKQAQEKGAKGMGFSLEQLKKLVELCYSEDMVSDRREVSVLAKRKMGEQILTLEMHLWQT